MEAIAAVVEIEDQSRFLRRFAVYLLIDPRDGIVRYVGKTENSDSRLKQHLYDSACGNHGNQKLSAWIEELRSCGMSPAMQIVKDGMSMADSNELE